MKFFSFAWQRSRRFASLAVPLLFPLLFPSLSAGSAWAADTGVTAATGVSATPARATLLPKLRTGSDDRYLEFYGHIDKGILGFDDGVSKLGYGPVDNANSSTRAGIRLYDDINDDASLNGHLEWEWNPYSTTHVNQENRGDYNWDANLLRKAELYIVSKSFGSFWAGQGSMASDGSAEVDLSGTTVVGYSAIADMAGGPFFRDAEGELSSVKVRDVFSNYDGVGRKLRVRYDTPSFEGFSLATSVGTEVVPVETGVTVWDIALRYEGTIDRFKISGAAAFSKPSGDRSIYDGSVSILDNPTGLSVTLAGGVSDNQQEDGVDGSYGYLKLGYQRSIFEAGKTAVSIDAYLGNDIRIGFGNSHSFGAQLVQNIDYLKTEVYLGARTYSYDEQTEDFDDAYAVLAGARVKF